MCEAVNERGQRRAVADHHLNELLHQLSTIIQQTPPDHVDAVTNSGTVLL